MGASIREAVPAPLALTRADLERLLIMGHASLSNAGLGPLFCTELTELLCTWLLRHAKGEQDAFFEWIPEAVPEVRPHARAKRQSCGMIEGETSYK